MMHLLPDPSFTVKQLSLVLGQDFSDADFELCADRIYSLEPKVGKFWQSNDSEPGLYILRSGKGRLLDESGELITTRSVGGFFGGTTLQYPKVYARSD